MAGSSLAQIAAELYAGPLGDFVTARDARAAEAADAELAARIRALRKPSVAAWVVNVFARERADRLGEALRLAQELREAQADLDARALATLGRQRRALTDQLAHEAAELASVRGGRVTASTIEAVRQTIAAAFFSPDASLAVASGRLIRELEPSTAFPLEAGEAVGGGPAGTPASASAPADEVAARRERRGAERAVHDAEQALTRARRDLGTADRELTAAARRVEELTERERALESELAEVRERLETAQSDISPATERQAEAEASAVAAEHALATARTALDRLDRSAERR